MMNKSSLEFVNCDICGQNDYDVFMKIRGLERNSDDEFSIVKCKECGMLFTNPRPIAQVINTASEECFGPWDRNKNRIEKESSIFIRKHPILRSVWHRIMGESLSEILKKSKGRALDLGCGFGDLLVDLTHNGCEAHGVETNLKAVEACAKKGLKVFCGTLEDANFKSESFDTVILFHVIEHLPYPEKTLREIYRILKPDGVALVYCPNADSYSARLFGRYWVGWSIPMHFYHFTVKTINILAERAGFEVNAIHTATPEYFFLHSLKLYIMNKGNRILMRLQKLGIFDYNIISRVSIAVTARALDAILPGKGECLMAELKKPDK